MVDKSELIAAFDGITDLIVILDADYRITFANKAFYDFYKIEKTEEIYGHKCYEIIHDESERCTKCPTHKTLKSGEVITLEKELRGEILKYWTYPVFDSNHSIINIVSYARIITGQKKTEQELIHSERLQGIGRLAAGTAHEINNPLCSILGYAELIQELIPADDPSYELLGDIIESAQQGKKIVAGLLEYSRQSVSYTNYCSIHDVIGKAASLIKLQKEKKITFDIKNGTGLPEVKIDMQKTVQALLNIILNAIDASPDGGTIDISAQQHGKDYISVKVRDRGCGIPEENESLIFNPFFTTKEVSKGTGLGLSIAQGIIEQQHGKIIVDSELGEGSTFEVLFPVKDQ